MDHTSFSATESELENPTSLRDKAGSAPKTSVAPSTTAQDQTGVVSEAGWGIPQDMALSSRLMGSRTSWRVVRLSHE